MIQYAKRKCNNNKPLLHLQFLDNILFSDPIHRGSHREKYHKENAHRSETQTNAAQRRKNIFSDFHACFDSSLPIFAKSPAGA